MLEAFRLGSICFLLSFVSAGSVGGDLFKAVFLARRRPGKRVEAVASVLVDRGVGLYGLLLVVAAALLLRDPARRICFSRRGRRADRNLISKIKLVTAVLATVGNGRARLPCLWRSRCRPVDPLGQYTARDRRTWSITLVRRYGCFIITRSLSGCRS